MMKKKIILLIIFWIININTTVYAEEIDIFTAARQGSVIAIKAYILEDKDINIVNHKAYTPFILAAYYGHTQVLDVLLQADVDACAVDKKGSNAFMGVAFKGYDQVAKWLLENTGCNVNHQNYAGQTALMMASLFGREEMVRMLLEHGANQYLADNQGNTSIKLAQAQGLSRIVEIIQFHLQ
jgi:ankyrin repeat protein